MSYLLPHLNRGWEVDQAIVSEEDRVVVIRFGRDSDPTCMVQDEVLANIAEKVKNFAVIYVVDIDEVPDFNAMYELYDPCTTMFFYRNKHIMVDLGTGDNNKINWGKFCLPRHRQWSSMKDERLTNPNSFASLFSLSGLLTMTRP